MDFLWSDALNLFTIIKRSQQHLPLTPSERAWLKAYKGIVRAVLLALVLALYQFLQAHASLAGINWQVELTSLGSLLWTTYLEMRAKFFTAQAPQEVKAGQIMGSVARGNATFNG